MLIAGLGGNCKDALVDMLGMYQRDKICFYTDDPTDKNIAYFEQKQLVVIKGPDELKKYFESHPREFVSFIGNNYARAKQVAFITKHGGKPASFISKTALVNTDLSNISNSNAIVMDFAHVSAGSILEEGSVVYSYTAIAHDVTIGKYAFMSAKCAISNSTVGDFTFVGLNTMIGPGVSIGKNCIVGANSYVKNDLPDNVVAAGIPAKIIRENKMV